MKPLRHVALPGYLARPSQIRHRLSLWRRGRSATLQPLRLPWGAVIQGRTEEDLGYGIAATGVADLVLTELLWRMVKPGDCVADVGANIGYASLVCALRAGSGGSVHAFEPHPALQEELVDNLALWRGDARMAPIKLVRAAVGAATGRAILYEPEAGFAANRGTSSLRERANGARYEVEVLTLDGYAELAGSGRVFVKIDVEGAEAEVLRGAQGLLQSERIQHMAFEEFAPYPAATHQMLEGWGYRILHLEPHLFGPKLMATRAGFVPPNYIPANYLATRDAEAAREAFARGGWQCLRGGEMRGQAGT